MTITEGGIRPITEEDQVDRQTSKPKKRSTIVDEAKAVASALKENRGGVVISIERNAPVQQRQRLMLAVRREIPRAFGDSSLGVTIKPKAERIDVSAPTIEYIVQVGDKRRTRLSQTTATD